MEPVYVILNALLDSGRFTRKLILLGLSGTFSYIFGSIVATLGMGLVVDYLGWGGHIYRTDTVCCFCHHFHTDES